MNRNKSSRMVFTNRRVSSTENIVMNGAEVPQDVKYLSTHIDKSSTWRKHIIMKKNQLNIKTIILAVGNTSNSVFPKQAANL